MSNPFSPDFAGATLSSSGGALTPGDSSSSSSSSSDHSSSNHLPQQSSGTSSFPLTATTTMAPKPASPDVDFIAPSIEIMDLYDPHSQPSTTTTATAVPPPMTSSYGNDPFFVPQQHQHQQHQSTGLATYEGGGGGLGAYGGATWTSPLEKKYNQSSSLPQTTTTTTASVSVLPTAVAQQPQQQPQIMVQKSTTTGLSGFAAPPPLPSPPLAPVTGNNGNMLYDASTAATAPATAYGGASDMGMGMAMGGGPMGGSSGTGSFGTSPPQQAEEDKDYLEAQRMAMEAKAMMEKHAQQQQKKQEGGGFLGLGKILNRQQQSQQANQQQQDHQEAGETSKSTPASKSSLFQTASTTRDAGTPPWHPSQGVQAASQHAATSDFGLPPAPAPATNGQQQQHQPHMVANYGTSTQHITVNNINHANTTPVNTGATNNPNGGNGPGRSAQVMGATVVGGVAGLMLVGPLVGVVAAGSAAYAAGTKEGPVGTILRGTGSLAATAGGAAKRFDNRHQVVSKTANGVAASVSWVVKTVNNAT